jgi:hypothetical protein
MVALIRTFEEKLGRPITDDFDLVAGTSTGAILGAGIAHGMTGKQLPQARGGVSSWLAILAAYLGEFGQDDCTAPSGITDQTESQDARPLSTLPQPDRVR